MVTEIKDRVAVGDRVLFKVGEQSLLIERIIKEIGPERNAFLPHNWSKQWIQINQIVEILPVKDTSPNDDS